MEAQLGTYEEAKRAIRTRKVRERRTNADLDERDRDWLDRPPVELSDITQVGAKVLIGGGLGLLAGVATIAVAASAAEVVLAGAITKVAGVVGGATGLSLGIRNVKNKKKKRI